MDQGECSINIKNSLLSVTKFLGYLTYQATGNIPFKPPKIRFSYLQVRSPLC